jgi:SAM-dependent methyltransferase
MSFKDHFSERPDSYKKFRPGYPERLFEHLASQCPARQQAWDCATGNGQAAVHLSKHFQTVVATDASVAQIAHAARHPGIRYAVAAAENAGLESNSVDLVTVAQALHWFDIEAFSAEVSRVLTDKGVLAVWSYQLLSISEDVDPIIQELYNKTLGSFWPPERRLVDQGYRDIQLPFRQLDSPNFKMHTRWQLGELLGYLNTWSAVHAYAQQNGASATEQAEADLAKVWGSPELERPVSWPLTLKIWTMTDPS